jgi:NhaP-type Na+/H+ or K+/H+ antiporter
MDRTIKALIAVAGGLVTVVVTFLFVTPAGCNEGGGLPSWERCITIMGTPAFSVSDLGLGNEFEILIPVLAGLLVGILTWAALGSSDQER